MFDLQIKSASSIAIDGDYIREFYPNIDHEQLRELLKSAKRVWDNQVLNCSSCEISCLTDGYGLTSMFDRLRDTGWPT